MRIVQSKSLTAPPTGLTIGVVYIPAASATGAWLGFDDYIMEWSGSDWRPFYPAQGEEIFVVSDCSKWFWNKSTWIILQDGLAPSSVLDVVSVSTNFSLSVTNDVALCSALSKSIVVTLLTAIGNIGKDFYIKKVDSTTNLVTVDGFGSETIDKSSTLVLSTEFQHTHIVSDGANWLVI